MKPSRFAPLAVAALLVVAWKVGNSCGPWLPTAQFHEINNWIDRGQLLKGQLGIVRPTFFHKSLLTAYRYLTNAPLSQAEIDALYPADPSDPYSVKDPVEAEVDAWTAKRNAIKAIAPPQHIDPFGSIPPPTYGQFYNCLSDAFHTASQTLDRRIALWGATNKNTVEWIRGQDQVFSNCSGPPSIPAEAPAQADPVLAADRRYQIAAAEFYARRFADALRDFDAISHDTRSEWQAAAPYLAARVVIRQASLEDRPELLGDAKRRLEQIAPDSTAQHWSNAAKPLLDLIAVRQDPGAYLVRTGAQLAKPGLGSGILQVFNDFNQTWDRTKEFPADPSGVVDWIRTYQNPSGGAHALERWRATHSAPWLIASLQHLPVNSSDAAPLLAAAAALRPTDAAYATATYLGIQIQTVRAPDTARQWADAALATRQPPAVDNAFRGERLALARDWTEFLRFAPRAPIARTIDLPDEPLDKPDSTKQFDLDASDALSRIAPLKRLSEAATSALLPRNLQLEVTRAAWTRAAVLENAPIAKDLALRLTQLQPDLTQDLQIYLQAGDAPSGPVCRCLRDAPESRPSPPRGERIPPRGTRQRNQ